MMVTRGAVAASIFVLTAAITRRRLVGDDIPTAPDLAAKPIEPYEPPRIDVLGTVTDLTKGNVGVGGDLNGQVLSF